jgi:hypothetical protein
MRRLLAGTALATLAIAGIAGPASAKPTTRPTSAFVVGKVTIDPNDPSVATVRARYACTAVDAPPELWVSVKQNDTGTVDRKVSAEGSGFGGVATRWEDSHRNSLVCDGQRHVGEFTVDQVEDKSSYGTLRKGWAWVQFCLFDDTTPRGNGQTDFGEPVSSMVWKHVS